MNWHGIYRIILEFTEMNHTGVDQSQEGAKAKEKWNPLAID